MADLDLRNKDYNGTTDKDKHFPAEGVNGALAVYGMIRNAEAISSAGNNVEEYPGGFYVVSAGGGEAWTIYPIDAGAGVSFIPTANTFYPYHVSRIDTTSVTGTLTYLGHL